MQRLRRRLRGPGCVWLVLVPLLLFLLCLLCDVRLLSCRQDDTTLLRMKLLSTALGEGQGEGVGVGEVGEEEDNATAAVRLQHLEEHVTAAYLRVQLALAVSAGSLRPVKGSGPALADVGTLSDLRTFQPLLTPREKAQLVYVFQLFSAACRTHDLSFFLLGTSLLGSVRHHGVVPWSDVSITVGMDAAEEGRIREALDQVEGTFFMWPNPYTWTLRLLGPPHRLRQTYLRIQLYHQNQTHVWAEAWANQRLFTAPKGRVFPLALRPFEGKMTPVPCDPRAVLPPGEVEVCRVVAEDLEEMVLRDAGVLQCDALAKVFPFVGRRLAMTASSTLEQVFVNGTLLSTVLVDNVCTPDSLWNFFS